MSNQPKWFTSAKAQRDYHKSTSNNAENSNKNWCALKVAEACGVADNVRYLHTLSDMKRALMTRYSIRSRKSAFKAKTVAQYKNAIANQAIEAGLLGYVIKVQGHVLLLSKSGGVAVDTDPRVRDRREVQTIHGLFWK